MPGANDLILYAVSVKQPKFGTIRLPGDVPGGMSHFRRRYYGVASFWHRGLDRQLTLQAPLRTCALVD
jgi:hypothetical protein